MCVRKDEMMKGFEKNFIASMIQVNVPRAEKFIVTIALVIEEGRWGFK